MATRTLNIALDERLIRAIDREVKEELGSRSEYFRRLAQADLSRRKTLRAILEKGNRKGRVRGIKSEQTVYRMIER